MCLKSSVKNITQNTPGCLCVLCLKFEWEQDLGFNHSTKKPRVLVGARTSGPQEVEAGGPEVQGHLYPFVCLSRGSSSKIKLLGTPSPVWTCLESRYGCVGGGAGVVPGGGRHKLLSLLSYVSICSLVSLTLISESRLGYFRVFPSVFCKYCPLPPTLFHCA